MNTETLRSQFPHTRHQTYLNHAAVSPMSRRVRKRVQGYLEDRHGARPEAAIANFSALQSCMEETKAQLGRVLGTEPGRIEFVPNTSAALNVLCRGLEWSSGDRIAVPDGTFPTNVYPFLNLEAEGVAVDFIPTREGGYTLEDIEQTLTPDTRLLSISWVHFLSGFRADLAAVGELCAHHDLLFCVDAIQGLGAMRIDVEACGIDFLASGGHKWLMAPQGIGLLYCDPDLQERLRPPTGWLHGPVDWEHLDRYELSFHEDARRFRTGTANAIGIVALNAALDLYLQAGPDWCEQRIQGLAARLADELEARGLPRYGTSSPDHRSGIVTVRPDAPQALADHLDARGIAVAVRNRKVRFSPTYYNNESDLHAVFEALDSFQ